MIFSLSRPIFENEFWLRSQTHVHERVTSVAIARAALSQNSRMVKECDALKIQAPESEDLQSGVGPRTQETTEGAHHGEEELDHAVTALARGVR